MSKTKNNYNNIVLCCYVKKNCVYDKNGLCISDGECVFQKKELKCVGCSAFGMIKPSQKVTPSRDNLTDPRQIDHRHKLGDMAGIGD